MSTVIPVAVELERLRQEVADLRAEIKDLSIKNDWMRRVLYGPSTERKKPEQDHAEHQQTFLTAPVDAGATVTEATAAQAKREDAETRKKNKNAKKGRGADGKKKAINGGGRKPVNRSLRTVEQIIPVPAADRVAADGTPLILLGYETSEREQYIASEIVRLVIKREVFGLPDTREEITRAAVPPAIVPKGKYSDTVILETMLRKFLHGIPFGKIVEDFRAMGSDLSDAELADLAARFARFIAPITGAIRAQVLSHTLIHIDETPLPTQDGNRYLWAWLGGTQAFFHSGGRGGKELRDVLKLPHPDAHQRGQPAPPDPARTWRFAFAMADGYQAYDTVLAECGIQRLCCWAHAKRGFLPFENDDPTAKAIVSAIDHLYHLEHEATRIIAKDRLTGDDATAYRQRHRHDHTVPQIAHIHALLADARPRYTPKTGMYNAIVYLTDRWTSFTAFAERGDLPIDNNAAERTIRPIVIGRKNWLFIGSEDAAPHAADLYTLFESCRLSRVEPRAYLAHVIGQLHTGGVDPATLTPAALASRFPRPR